MSTKKTPASKPRTQSAKQSAASSAPATDQPTEPVEKDMLRKRELIERVALRTGAKKKDVKPVVEVMLAEMGEALAARRACALPPLGRIVVNREKELPDGRVVILKLRQKKRSNPSVSHAEDGEDTSG